jgi:hypothetical protein
MLVFREKGTIHSTLKKMTFQYKHLCSVDNDILAIGKGRCSHMLVRSKIAGQMCHMPT